MTTRRYAVRRLNPFAGVVQVVTTDCARGISMDGRRWEIQVLAEAPNDCWGSLSRNEASIRFFRFGIWSADEGLSRVPINPIMDVGSMLETANDLITELQQDAPGVPFELEDNLELWLLDHDDQPLALMMSASPDEDLESLQPRYWSAAPMNDRNFGHERCDHEAPAADDLERLIRRTAKQRQGIWFRREAPGTGAGTPLASAALDIEPLPAAVFPMLPLRDDWSSKADGRLVARWKAWAAPRLLCLPYLSSDVQSELEELARGAALEVSAIWRLFPETVSTEFLRTARVEARLRKARDAV